MRVHLRSADSRVDAADVFSLETEEIRVETVQGNPEYITVVDVDSLDEVYAASQQDRVVVSEPSVLYDDGGIDVEVMEYNDYIE